MPNKLLPALRKSPLAGQPIEIRPHRIRGPIAALFLARHAIGADHAIAFVPRDPSEASAFDRLCRCGIIREVAPGRFYFCLDAPYAFAERQRRFVVPIAIIVSVSIAWIAMLFFRG